MITIYNIERPIKEFGKIEVGDMFMFLHMSDTFIKIPRVKDRYDEDVVYNAYGLSSKTFRKVNIDVKVVPLDAKIQLSYMTE